MAKAAASLLIAGLGSVTAFTVVGNSTADEPIPTGAAATVYRTVTERSTVQARVDGKPAAWWARRARSNGRTMRMRGRTLALVRHSLRSQVSLGASGLEQAFLCIHHFEGSWDDPNGPYYGGVQMDWDFMHSYAPEFLREYGPASKWTPAMQIATAERAYLSGRGFGPWPNTARMCGLR